MSLTVRIVSFVAFLGAYGGWVWITAKLVPMWQNGILKGKAFWHTQLQVLLEVSALFGFIWLLSGFFDAKLVLVWLAAAEVAIALNAILRMLFVSREATPGAAGAIAGAEGVARSRGVMIAFVVMSALPLVLFPVVAGIAHFWIDGSDDLDKAIVRYTLIFWCWYFVIGQGLGVYVLANANIDEESRLAALLARLTGLIPTGLFLAVLLWSLNVLGDEKSELSIGALSLAVSPLVGAGLVVWFLLGALLPYAIGARAAKEKREAVLRKEKDWVGKLTDALRFGGTARFAPALDELETQLAEELDHVEASEPLLAELTAVSAEPAPAASSASTDDEPLSLPGAVDDEFLLHQTVGVTPLGGMPSRSSVPAADESEALSPIVVQAFEKYRPRYLPAQYYDWLREQCAEVSTIRESLGNRKASAASRREAESWVGVLQDRTKRIDEGLDAESHHRAVAIVAVAGLGSATMSAFMSEFGNWAWTQVVGSVG